MNRCNHDGIDKRRLARRYLQLPSRQQDLIARTMGPPGPLGDHVRLFSSCRTSPARLARLEALVAAHYCPTSTPEEMRLQDLMREADARYERVMQTLEDAAVNGGPVTATTLDGRGLSEHEQAVLTRVLA